MSLRFNFIGERSADAVTWVSVVRDGGKIRGQTDGVHRYVRIPRMTIIKTPTSYFTCTSPAITAATFSSISFQPSN